MGACHCIGPTNARRQPGLSRARVRLPKDLLICIMYEYMFYVNVVYMLLYDVIWFLKLYYIEWYIFCMQLIINDKLYFGCLPLPSMPVENESVKPKISSRKKICHSGGGQWNRRGTHPTSGAQNGGMKANCKLVWIRLMWGKFATLKTSQVELQYLRFKVYIYTCFFLVKTYVWHIYLVVSSIHSPITSITSPAWLAARSGDLHGSSLNFSRESKPIFVGVNGRFTFLGTNISHSKGTFEDDFPFPQVGYVNSLEGNYFPENFQVWGLTWFNLGFFSNSNRGSFLWSQGWALFFFWGVSEDPKALACAYVQGGHWPVAFELLAMMQDNGEESETKKKNPETPRFCGVFKGVKWHMFGLFFFQKMVVWLMFILYIYLSFMGWIDDHFTYQPWKRTIPSLTNQYFMDRIKRFILFQAKSHYADLSVQISEEWLPDFLWLSSKWWSQRFLKTSTWFSGFAPACREEILLGSLGGKKNLTVTGKTGKFISPSQTPSMGRTVC